MPRLTPIFRKGRKALEDLKLLDLLRSEINFELSTSSFDQKDQSSGLVDFMVDWDSSRSQDVVLRRKCKSGEEVAVSALLGPHSLVDGRSFDRDVVMKVCVKKPGLSSILQFDCKVSEKSSSASQFDIYNAYFLHSETCPQTSAYRGPLFSTLDPRLQLELEKYLIAKGISESLINFLLTHLHKKELGQYVDWLHKVESVVAKGE